MNRIVIETYNSNIINRIFIYVIMIKLVMIITIAETVRIIVV